MKRIRIRIESTERSVLAELEKQGRKVSDVVNQDVTLRNKPHLISTVGAGERVEIRDYAVPKSTSSPGLSSLH